jgi:hypothetical protein
LLHYPPNNVPTTFSWPLSGYLVEDTQCHSNTVHFSHHVAMVKNMSPSLTFVSSFPRVHAFGALQISVDVGDASDSGECHQSKVSENRTLNGENRVIRSDSEDTIEDHKERQRRRKIGLANKGRVPWNKGKKHTAGNYFQNVNFIIIFDLTEGKFFINSEY